MDDEQLTGRIGELVARERELREKAGAAGGLDDEGRAELSRCRSGWTRRGICSASAGRARSSGTTRTTRRCAYPTRWSTTASRHYRK